MADTNIATAEALPGLDDRGGITPAAERAIARDLSPPIAWPTLALAVLLPASYGLIAWAGITGRIPLWLVTIMLPPICYAHYTLVHEAIHANILAAYPRLRGLETVIGWIGSMAIIMPYPILRRTHLLHHAHLNVEGKDPDLHVKGTFLQLLGKWLRFTPFVLLPPPLFLTLGLDKVPAIGNYTRLAKSILTEAEYRQVTIAGYCQLTFLALSIVTGNFVLWLMLWFIPQRIAAIILNTVFQWLPHHPFDTTERYRSARISLWPGGDLLTLWQNLHLVHHLWPSVPFYRYRRFYTALKPLLIARHARFEGLMVGPYTVTKSPDA